MGPVVVNGSIYTARKQHQRKNVPICVRVASRVLCELGLRVSGVLDQPLENPRDGTNIPTYLAQLADPAFDVSSAKKVTFPTPFLFSWKF